MGSSSSAGPPARTSTGPSRRLLVLAPAAALVLVALCLRGPFSAVGPVAGDLRAEFDARRALRSSALARRHAPTVMRVGGVLLLVLGLLRSPAGGTW